MSRQSISVRKQQVLGREVIGAEDDWLAIEEPLQLVLICQRAGKMESFPVSMTMRTPGFECEWAVGFLFSEGIIKKPQDFLSVTFRDFRRDAALTYSVVTVQLRDNLEWDTTKLNRAFPVNSSCGVCGKTTADDLGLPRELQLTDEFEVPIELIHALPEKMRVAQEAFTQTGGLHAAALFNAKGDLLSLHEDIGRHNALDKVIGDRLLRNEFPCVNTVLVVSGRMSYEIIQKALMARIPIIAGVGAPSSLAILIANDFDMTVVGFVRNGRYNVYSSAHRLKTIS